MYAYVWDGDREDQWGVWVGVGVGVGVRQVRYKDEDVRKDMSGAWVGVGAWGVWVWVYDVRVL